MKFLLTLATLSLSFAAQAAPMPKCPAYYVCTAVPTTYKFSVQVGASGTTLAEARNSALRRCRANGPGCRIKECSKRVQQPILASCRSDAIDAE